ncbi:MAG TPA: hypothetical protein VFW71_16085 [Actinomycetota bacterium]|nr:hypothetical protein [Actinomycetota bacterium]
MDAFGIVSIAGLAAVSLVAAGAVSDFRRHVARPKEPPHHHRLRRRR